MPFCSILLDSNAYFRLAQNIHPLLKVDINGRGARLGVVKELQLEYEQSPRLRNKFYWVNQSKYVRERRGCFKLNRIQNKDIELIVPFMRDYALQEGLGVSRIDITIAAYAYAIQVPVVTDDGDMAKLLKEYGIKAFTTLEIMKIMLDGGFIKTDRIRAIAGYWKYQKDTPKSFKEDYKRLFGTDPP